MKIHNLHSGTRGDPKPLFTSYTYSNGSHESWVLQKLRQRYHETNRTTQQPEEVIISRQKLDIQWTDGREGWEMRRPDNRQQVWSPVWWSYYRTGTAVTGWQGMFWTRDTWEVGTRIAWVRLRVPICNLFVVVVYVSHKGRQTSPRTSDIICIQDLNKLLMTVP